MNGNRSPHASHLHSKWGKDAAWMAGIGAHVESVEGVQAGGQMVVEATAEPAVGQQESAKVAGEKRAKETKTRAAKKSSATRVLRPLPCVSLGAVTKRAGSCCPRKNTHTCKLGVGGADEAGGETVGVQPAVQCETCEKYVADPEAKADADAETDAEAKS